MDDRRAKRILLVDDEPHILRLMTMQLTRHGYHVDSAANGELALAKLEQGMPDVIITDIQMPRMDGRTLCQRILTDYPDAHPLIIITTSRTELEHREWSRTFKTITFLEKPISLHNLIDRLKRHFENAVEAAGQ